MGLKIQVCKLLRESGHSRTNVPIDAPTEEFVGQVSPSDLNTPLFFFELIKYLLSVMIFQEVK